MTSALRWVEVHRLAVAGGEAAIARDVGDRVARAWLPTSRFADVARVAELTLSLGDEAGAFYDLGTAWSSTGRGREAVRVYEQALALYRASGHRRNEAATLSGLGRVYGGLGDRGRA